MKSKTSALLGAMVASLTVFLLLASSGGSSAAQNPANAAQIARPSGDRVFLSRSQSQRAAATGLLPPNIRSLLNIPSTLRHGAFVWNDRGVPQGDVAVVVHLDKQLVSVFRSGHEIGSSVVTFGAEGMDTPVGSFPILAKMRDHRSSSYDAEMPFTLRLTPDGVSIHGSDVRWGTATHGCIGVPNGFARLLFDQVRVGQEVVIKSAD